MVFLPGVFGVDLKLAVRLVLVSLLFGANAFVFILAVRAFLYGAILGAVFYTCLTLLLWIVGMPIVRWIVGQVPSKNTPRIETWPDEESTLEDRQHAMDVFQAGDHEAANHITRSTDRPAP